MLPVHGFPYPLIDTVYVLLIDSFIVVRTTAETRPDANKIKRIMETNKMKVLRGISSKTLRAHRLKVTEEKH